MRIARFVITSCLLCAVLALHAQQGAPPAPGGPRGQGGGRAGGGTPGQLIGGTLTPAKADARGWGWQVKASVNATTPRPFYNKAKELLFQDKQVTSYTISSFNTDLYCEVGKHFDFIWFEMQHSTMSWDEVRRMLLACPGVGAAPMVRTPDALEATIQKTTDIGAIGVIVPTVDDALEARDAARFYATRRSAVAVPVAGRSARCGLASTIGPR